MLRPDPVLLRELVETGSAIAVRPGLGRSEEAIRAAESAVGPLPASYRWWLATYGVGEVGGVPIATVDPDGAAAPAGYADAPEAVTGGLDGDRLRFCEEPGGDDYSFALDRREGEECPVVRRDHLTGEEEQFAETFAGFLGVREALAAGLRDGPNPTIARLWRTTPGMLLPDGVLVYGPQTIRERNETYEVGEYAPHWVLVGDDSGGNGLFMRHHGRDRTSVYALGLGAIEADVEHAGEPVTDDLIGWLADRA
ncbi:hypothetical protein FHS29_004411 [Saccharothrix tamanrassetensis]|uniref:Knr4/Smi1-like domain-containing protein n=1 Tax=Saccharothrix tamanrassetensis TaxID=1051531 RepID=A0A841CQP1_9PSEU|nr:SMI1/KNR4 family protein [Saccharothrix tamanrassetensis]MBB5957816.1 hypothetical protein [Saccharothrix tamanrassetensis]